MKNRELLKTGQKPAPGELALVQGFINTADREGGTDDLASPVALMAWISRHGLSRKSVQVTNIDHEMIVAFRESLRLLLAGNHGEWPNAKIVKQLNRLVRDYAVTVRFGADGRALLEPRGAGAQAVVAYLLTIIARATLDGSWSRLRVCQASTCQWAFYDVSKNHSGRWCSMSVCGSRAKARQYRKRQVGKG